MEMKPVNIEEISESKKLIGMTPRFKTMYLSLEEGKEMLNRSHDGFVSLFVYEGKMTLRFENGEEFQLKKGSYLAFDGRVKHSVIVEAPSKILTHMCFEE